MSITDWIGKTETRSDTVTVGPVAALSATLRLYLRSADLASELPTLRFLGRSIGEIRSLAPRVRDILAERLGPEFKIEIVEASSAVGSGALPEQELPTVAVAVTHRAKSPNSIAAMFRRARIIGRIADDAFQLDLRTVENPAVFAVSFITD